VIGEHQPGNRLSDHRLLLFVVLIDRFGQPTQAGHPALDVIENAVDGMDGGSNAIAQARQFQDQCQGSPRRQDDLTAAEGLSHPRQQDRQHQRNCQYGGQGAALKAELDCLFVHHWTGNLIEPYAKWPRSVNFR